MKKNNDWFEKIFFSGSEVLYPFMSIVCFFFFFFFFGNSEQNLLLNGQTPSWLSWYIFAILGFVFCSLWGIIYKLWNRRFLTIGTIILFFSFYMLQENLSHLLKDTVSLIIFSILIAILCCIKFMNSNLKGKFSWSFPLIILFIYYVFDNILLTLVCCLFGLVTVAINETSNGYKNLKLFVSICIIIFYSLTTLTYFPYYNPFYLDANIKSINVSYNPGSTSLVIEKDNKYIIVNGRSLSKNSIIDAKFDSWKKIYPGYYSFVGFSTGAHKNAENKEMMSLNRQSKIYPIVISDSCVYFISGGPTYPYLAEQKKSDSQLNKLTAKIFNDFIDLYNNNDSTTLSTLKRHQSDLQTVLEEVTVDSLVFNSKEFNNEKILKDFSRNLSIGMLNALCSDLILNNDINSGLNVFSYQFYFTFFNTPIYDRGDISFNISINKSYDSRTDSISYHITENDLKREDTFEPWVKIASMCRSFAELYLSEAKTKINKDIQNELSVFAKQNEPTASNTFNRNYTIEKKKRIEEILLPLSSYSSTPTIKEYVTSVQKFLYQCILNNYLPDYNSFFINRFNEITPMVPMNPESITAYKNMEKLFSNRFTRDIENVKQLRQEINDLYSTFDQTIIYQDSIENLIANLKLSSQDRELLKKILYNYVTSKKAKH